MIARAFERFYPLLLYAYPHHFRHRRTQIYTERELC
jgi:hypothetical protein